MERSEIPRYVADASIAVKWFIEERETPKARKLRQLFQDAAIDLEAPSLLGYEVASALRFHPVARLTSKQFRTVMESLDDIQIMREPNKREWTVAFELSQQNPISIYDAIYVAFALCGDSKMITADAALLAKLKSHETRQVVTTLSGLSL